MRKSHGILKSYSKPEKVMDFWENGQGHEKLLEFHLFGPNISCCLKTENILLIEKNVCLKKAVFQHFLVMENLN